MKKKFILKDSNVEEVFEVEEVVDTTEQTEAALAEEIADEGQLSTDDIAKLKSLLPVLDKILALVNGNSGAPADEEITDTEESRDEEVGTPESERVADSIGSPFSNERKKSKVADSIDRELEIEQAWAERYKR